MPIIRNSKRSTPYVIIDKSCLDDSRLTLKERGLLVYLLSKPSNWKIYVSELVKTTKEGKDSIASAIKALELAGYIRRNKIRNTDGIIMEHEIIVFESPQPYPENQDMVAENPHPDPGLPDLANPQLINNEVLSIPSTKDNKPCGSNKHCRKQENLSLSADIKKVFSHWQLVMDHPTANLDEGRIKLIRKALHMGYSADELCEAITGCSLTPHNIGINDRNQRYDGLHIILRNADQIDRFIGNAKSPPKNNGGFNETGRGNNQRRSKADIHAEATKGAFEPGPGEIGF